MHAQCLVILSASGASRFSFDQVTKMFEGVLNDLFDGFDRRTRQQLKNAWSTWLLKLQQTKGNCWEEAELIVTTLNICCGHIACDEDTLSHKDYSNLSQLTNKICHKLSQFQKKKELGEEDLNTIRSSIKSVQMEQDMQAFVKLVLEESGGIDRSIKQTFFSVVRTFYYSAYYDADTLDAHMFKVLFEPVV